MCVIKDGWIEVISGCMFAGKTEELIRRINMLSFANKKIQIFKPLIDNRYEEEEIVSHNNRKIKAIRICNAQQLIEFLDNDTEVIAIDEIQFFTSDILIVLEQLADQGKRIIVAGLDKDFRGEPFKCMPELLTRAEFVTKLEAICVKCHSPATRTQRIINGSPASYHDPIVLIGANEFYEARCRHCHIVNDYPQTNIKENKKMNVKTRERLETMKHRYNEINSLLSQSDINNNIELLTKLSKERAKLNDTVLLYMKYLSIESNLQEIKNIFQNEKDADLLNLAKEELKGNEESLLFVEQQLTVALLPANPNDDKNVIIEIRGAAGGDEANIFAGDLYRMYLRYCESQNWKTELLDARISNSGGFSQISFLIKGEKVYAKMKFEAGSHRVQRIPKTESQGRVHTSTATVVVLPEASALDVDVKPSELKIDTYRASGAGGQHVNTTDSAVRITHLPTGIVATSQDGRSQHDNKDKALKVLLAKIYEAKLEAQQSEMGTLRKSAVGSGVRAEKIRTYNYPQNRVSDHRINLTLNKLDRIMLGELNEIINALIDDEQKRKMGMED